MLVYDSSVTPTTEQIEAKLAVQRLKKQFWWFATIASLNHALNYVINSYATSLIDTKLAGIILGLNWSLNSVSGLTIATAVVRRLGYKYSMIVSFWGYTIQIATLYIAIICRDIAYPIAIIGGVIAGFTSAIWWTAQGVCFERTSEEIELILSKFVYGKDSIIQHIRSDLSAHWTIIYQVSDIFVFLLLSGIPILFSIGIPDVIAGLIVLGVITSLLGFTFDPLGEKAQSQSWSEIGESMAAVPIQFANDSRATLLAPFVFGFGITTAMFSYYVNSTLVTDSSNLGIVTLGVLEAFSYLIAVISAYPYAYISNKFIRGQDFVIQFGSFSFMMSGLVVFALPNNVLSTWGGILVVKGLYGLGRGVFEGSCRAVYAQMFAGKDLGTAFSGQTLLAGFSGGTCLFLFGILDKHGIAAVTIINGTVAIICYGILMSIDSRSPINWSRLCQHCFYCGYSKDYYIPADIDDGISRNNIQQQHIVGGRYMGRSISNNIANPLLSPGSEYALDMDEVYEQNATLDRNYYRVTTNTSIDDAETF
eukprot:gene7170-9773_t